MYQIMKFNIIVTLTLLSLIIGACLVHAEKSNSTSSMKELSNSSYRLVAGINDGEFSVTLFDKVMGIPVAEGPYIYKAQRTVDEGAMLCRRLAGGSVTVEGENLTIRGKLAGLDLQHRFSLPRDRQIMEERITLRNATDKVITLEELEMGLRRCVASRIGRVLQEVVDDRICALPFRKRPTDIDGEVHECSVAELLAQSGAVQRVNMNEEWNWQGKGFSGHVPSSHRSSEGWAWTHGDSTFCVFKFNQQAMEFSVLSTVVESDAVCLRFGGACMVDGVPSCLLEIGPGQSIDLGITRYQTVKGIYLDALYTLRAFLDERGCRFAENYDPPVHWNELYDNSFWSLATPGQPASNSDDTRAVTYTRELIEREAAKAKEYSCESLYLDPGWDTNFGTFIWGESWLGPRKKFITDMKSQYGLDVSLHCPLASWMCHPVYRANNPGVADYPRESFRMDSDGKVIEGSICLGSRQYLETAEKRMLENCADGVVFLMFDGDWYQGGCWNPDHGHPVPYRKEDQVNAVARLAQRIHTVYPDVLIEMHDPIGSGSAAKFTPVYYKYGLPGSFDENWGFELMWRPMHDLRTGAAKALFYYNMGCNVPVYLHVDLRDDNEYSLVLWWYASTCRHLGIGGTHHNHLVVQSQKKAMQRYRQLERFYKQGEFYGINEEIHLHVLADKNAFVVNLFNLSDETRTISGEFHLDKTGLDLNRWYGRSGKWGEFAKGVFKVSREMAPWSAEVGEFRAIDTD